MSMTFTVHADKLFKLAEKKTGLTSYDIYSLAREENLCPIKVFESALDCDIEILEDNLHYRIGGFPDDDTAVLFKMSYF